MFDFYTILYFVGLALTLFFAVALVIFKRGTRSTNYFLAILLFMISFSIVNAILVHTKYIFYIPHFIGITWPLSFLYPPLFYLYVKSLIIRDVNLKKQLYQFVPFIIFIFCLIPFYLQSGDQKVSYLLAIAQKKPLLNLVISSLIFLQELVYITLSLRVLYKHTQNIESVYSSVKNYTLSWVSGLIISYILVTILFFVIKFLDAPIEPFKAGSFFVVGFIYILGFWGMKQSDVFTGMVDSNSKRKYEKSRLDSAIVSEYLKNLNHRMEKDKLYTDSNLTLYKLANELKISPNHLSQILNESLNQSFFDFVNSYRVEAAKKMLHKQENNHLTILAIAYDVGFSSKSTFNSVFKKMVKMTPSKFKQTAKGF